MIREAVLVVSVFLASYASAGDVLTFTDSDFADRSRAHDLLLVKFYAPWCGHCKKLAPEFEKAATQLLANDPPVSLAEMDCTADSKDTCSKFGVSGYPTLKIFKNGELSSDYNGPRDADGIVKYMRSKAGPTSKELKSVADAQKFLDNNDHSIVGFFEKEGSELQQQFMKVADSMSEDFRFAYTSNADVLKKYNHKDEMVIYQPPRLHTKMEPTEQKYTGEVSQYQMKDWISNNIHGLVGVRTTTNQEQFKKPLVVVYYDVDFVKNPKGTNYWRNRVIKVAKQLTEAGKNIHFAVSSAQDFSHELSEFGMSVPTDKPAIAARDAEDKKYVMSAEFSVDNLNQFAKDFLDGKIEAYLKSEPVPASNDEPVKVVVAKTFDEIVNDNTKDVLIEFYAPWCGHCKNLAPKYDELAKKLEDESEIVIAKMDATANDVPSPYSVRGFPTLYFSPMGSKSSPVPYNGGREVDDFIKYLAKESTNPLKGYDRDGKKTKKSKTEL